MIDAKEKEDEKRAEAEGADEVEAPAAEAEQKRIEDEEEAAAEAVGDLNYRRKPTKLSKKRRRREEQRRRALTGEEWSADALLCWGFEAKGDVLATLEEHSRAVEQYKLSLRHLVYLRKEASARVERIQLEEGGATLFLFLLYQPVLFMLSISILG